MPRTETQTRTPTCRIVQSGLGLATFDETGRITRITDDGYRVEPSDNWRILGAVEYNNFGQARRRYTLAEIIADPSRIPWRFKNGKQRTYLRDSDHGTTREWQSPDYTVEEYTP